MKQIKEQKKEDSYDLKRLFKEWFFIILTAVAIALFFNSFIIANSWVPSNSMENTIMTNDRIVGSRLAYLRSEPERGDIIIFDHRIGPSDKETRLVKRVIGLPGETVDIYEGRIYIDGSDAALEEPYLNEEMTTGEYHFQVPEDCYLMMGDNRNTSGDARQWTDPYVPKKKIIAKVLFRYFPSVGKIE